jgi:hypothetical protein
MFSVYFFCFLCFLGASEGFCFFTRAPCTADRLIPCCGTCSLTSYSLNNYLLQPLSLRLFPLEKTFFFFSGIPKKFNFNSSKFAFNEKEWIRTTG